MDKSKLSIPVFPLGLTDFHAQDFDKANEILFRLGIIYKQQGKFEESLACFDRILRNPPSPLAHADIWFQIGHVYEQQKDVSFLSLYQRSALISTSTSYIARPS
jgi:tetratricopeptide (TPR) repeat protein